MRRLILLVSRTTDRSFSTANEDEPAEPLQQAQVPMNAESLRPCIEGWNTDKLGVCERTHDQ